MTFFNEDAESKARVRQAFEDIEDELDAADKLLTKEVAVLTGEILGCLVGAWIYRRLGAPKWAAWGLVGIELRLSRILRAVSR